jgi:GH15 family glucan-1,4-alpha-glucosidase
MTSGYLPIEDHGAIGNLRTVALVGRDGAVSWCPLPGLEDASVFASILDIERGGRFMVRPAGSVLGDQRYVEHSNVLETSFDTAGGGRLVVTDCMPLRGDLAGTGGSTAEPEIHRVVRAEGGDIDVEVEWSPRFQYGNGRPTMMAVDGRFLAWAGADSLSLAGIRVDEAEFVEDDGATTLSARFRLSPGERRALVTSWGPSLPAATGLEYSQGIVAQAVDSWRTWVHETDTSRSWAAPHEELIIRAELTIKMLSHCETGAIAAAATTSLPEEIGGVRNWDYRFAWIRDAALAAQALHALDHDADAYAFVEWAEQVARAHHGEDRAIQVVYGLHGETEIGERELPNLEGYCRSSPVRTGNGAVDQLQLDDFGELISAVFELVRFGTAVDQDILDFLPEVGDDACRQWNQRDYGLWELRNGPFNFVYSKVMVWVALDRAAALAEHGVIDGDVERWRQTCASIREEVLGRGFDPDLGAFRQSYERSALDASNLLFPLLEFLPFDDPRVESNLDATIEGLTEDGLVHRYLTDDGLAGGEGAFVLCNFWLVDALAMGGRVAEARALFDRMVGHANHLGLYSEQIDPKTGAFLGNFPQVFSHIGLVNSALYLAYVEGRDSPVPDPIGSKEHRANRTERTQD